MSVSPVCPICLNPQYHILFHKNNIPIYRCESCGVGKADLKNFDIESYYTASYFNGEYSDGYADYINARDVLHIQFNNDIKLLKKHGKHRGHILELGCAYGYFLDKAKEASFEISGIELCEDAVKSCNDRGYNNVYRGEISNQNLKRFAAADAVVLFDVIEHLPDPITIIEAIAEKLKPDGLLLMTTGDFSSLFAKITASNWRLMTPPQHLWFFTPSSLELLCNRFGLELVSLDYPWKKVPLGLILFQMLRYVGVRPKLPNWTHTVGFPVNLFDAMRLVFRKRTTA